MPQWQQDMRVVGERNDMMGIQSKTTRNTKAHFIPFVKEGTRRISALLMVKVSGTDTAYKMIYRQHYLKYGFTERPGKWNARTVMLLFATMEEQVFGYKNFIVKDGRIMGGKIGERFRISFEPDATSSDSNNQRSGLVTTCKNYKSCFTVGGPYICANRTVCKTEFVYDQPEEVQSFLDDDTGADVSGGDTTFILVEPCPDQNTSTQTGWQQPDDSFYAIDPCDETAGWEEEVFTDEDALFRPCANSFNFVRTSTNSNWQSAVVKDNRFVLKDLRTGKGDFTINIGTIEIGMPFKTFDGSLIHAANAREITTLAASITELAVLMTLNAQIIASPTTTPLNFDNQHYKNMFKEVLKSNINDLLSKSYYGTAVDVARIGYDSGAFSLKDPSQYKNYDFSQDGCGDE